MKRYSSFFLLLLFQSLACGAISSDTLKTPFPAHAHNDYLHEHPLFDALENGFRSMEADVFASGDSLFVAHNRKDIESGRTLRTLYLEPLRAYFSEEGHVIYDNDSPLLLFIDIKDDGLTSYKLLEGILSQFLDMLCKVSQGEYEPGMVMVLISGNRPVEYMQYQAHRLAFVDGRIPDLGEVYPAQLMPVISDRWGKYFKWWGKGEMPAEERMRLRMYVQQAHENGQLIRFWATPDRPGKERDLVWKELLDAGVDLINTDDLSGLRQYLSEE